MTDGVWIIGAGGHAKVAIAIADSMGLSVSGLYDDDPARQGATVLGRPVMGPPPDLDWWRAIPRRAFIAIGDNRVRKAKAALFPAQWVTLRHATAWMHGSVALGPGAMVCAGAMVQPEASVGTHSIVNTGVIVEHDCRIGDFTHVAGGAVLAGACRLGHHCFIGAGATILPGVTIGDNVTVGAGAAVVGDVPAGLTVMGVPARAKS
ncbi:MAG: acetyltransferase [Parvibaculaceae bacterium]|nr:acetyltransferase [Parvibaculaceae bacterium]